MRALLAAWPESVNDAVAKQMGWRPLHVAARADRANIVRLLLDHGASVTCEDDQGRTPLDAYFPLRTIGI